MHSFKHFITERYVNLINDNALKQQHKAAVWDILQLSYASMGGIKGSGFSSPDDMVKNIPFWKLAVKGGKVVAVVLYKDVGGRKFVALGTNGSEVGKLSLFDMMKNEMSRSYGEVSKAALGVMMHQVPWDILKHYVKKPAEAKAISGKEDVTPIQGMKDSDLPEDAKKTLARYPQLREYGYLRDIGGKIFFKILMGTPNLKIR
jgi:hypothetical protein